MTKFEFIPPTEDTVYSTAIHNLKDHFLNGNSSITSALEKQSKKFKLDSDRLLQKTLKAIKEENGGVLPENLEKYEK